MRLKSLAVLIMIVTVSCTTTIESECELDNFIGMFSGNYNIGGILSVPTPDTLILESHPSNENMVIVTSVTLDTFFTAQYSDSKNRLNVPSLALSQINVAGFELYDISIKDGFITLDGGCDKLFLQLNKLNVIDHNVDDLPKPLVNLDITSPDFMNRL